MVHPALVAMFMDNVSTLQNLAIMEIEKFERALGRVYSFAISKGRWSLYDSLENKLNKWKRILENTNSVLCS